MAAARYGGWAGAIVFVAIVAAGGLRAEEDGDVTWVIEPGPEEDGADAAAATQVAQAQKLAKKKQVSEAVAIFETVAREHPASAHDCNLSLAYLRDGQLTRAQLHWDVAALRNGARPDWCTGSLARELAKALDQAGLVPLTITVTPADAVIEIAGVAIRSLRVVWIAPGTHPVSARAPGRVDAVTQVAVTAPSATVTLTLESVEVAPPIDAAVVAVEPSPDAGAGPLPQAPAAAEAQPVRWPGWVVLGVGVVGLAGGAGFHAAAVRTSNQADAERFASEPEFVELRDRFELQRNLALTGYAVGIAATAIGAYWLYAKRPRRGASVSATIGDDRAVLTVEWALP